MSGVIYAPRPVAVAANEHGVPRAVTGVEVETVREDWLVEDRWWSTEPIARRYFELVLADGRCEIVFAERGRWFAQRA